MLEGQLDLDGDGFIRVHEQGTSNVKAQQDGSWTVGISGTPNVAVSSSAGSPVWVKNASASVFEPYGSQRQATSAAMQVGFTMDEVPAGKILVLETVSVFAFTPDDGGDVVVRVGSYANDPYLFFDLTEQSWSEAGKKAYVGTQNLSRYYAAGENVNIDVMRSMGGVTTATYWVSAVGHLVDAGQ